MRLRAPGFRIGAAYGVAFSPSGRLLGQVGRRVLAYDVTAREVTLRSQWHYPYPASVAFGQSDAWMAIRSTTGAIVVLDTRTGQPWSRLPPEGDQTEDGTIAARGDDHLVEACWNGTLRVRRARDLKIEYAEQHPADMLGPVAGSSDGTRWVLAFNRKQLDAARQPPCRIEVRAWPLSGGPRHSLGEEFGHIAALASTPVGDRIAILERRRRVESGWEMAIVVVSERSGAVEAETTGLGWREHAGFAWSPGGEYLVVGTDHGHALLDGQTLTPIGQLAGKYASDAAFSPDGRLLALGYWGHGMVLPVADLRGWFNDEVPAPDASGV